MDFREKAIRDNFRILGVKGRFFPKSGDPIEDVPIIKVVGDDTDFIGQTQLRRHRGLFQIQVADVEEVKKGDRLVFAGETFEVQSAVKEDDLRLVWSVEAPPVRAL